ncbi:MAG TPA: GreA/GreB family elongation factor [Candidatus Sulfotelmatobacter sp.]|nr:GreA/GreB family elongation factor [Candidatus Sulfotelmatobacter sp.]
MPDGSVIVTDADMDRLTRLVRTVKHSLFRDQQQLELLAQTLASAEVRVLGRVPKDVIRMHSRVRVFDFDTGRRGQYSLVFPDEANISRGMISVLAPLGIALLGRRKGDVIEAQVPGGARKLRVDAVRQEAGMKGTKPSEDNPTRHSHLPRSHQTSLAA